MSFPGAGGGGDNSVFVTIGGNSMPLVDACRIAAEALLGTSKAAETLGATSEALGGASTTGAEGLARESAAATETSGRLEALAAMARETSASMTQIGATLGGVGNGVIGLMGGLGGAIGDALDPMVGFIRNAGAMVAGLVSFSVLNDVIQEVKGFTDALVQLNIQTEKNQFSWQYLYGGGRTPQGAAVAQQMADWTKGFSMQIPYTRQDLLNAITTLAPAGLSAAGLEHFMPTIADLAATRAPNMNLSQIAQVIMSASMGYTRMLKYDLKINPEELIQYGLDATGRGVGIHINNPETLLPALENYAKAKGLSGAAKDIAHDTFWGSWSSFIDRIQNFELDSGHGLFGSLKNALNDLSSWIDAHYDQINRFAALFSDTLANAFKTAAGWVGDFMAGVGQSGFLDFLHLSGPADNIPAPLPTTPGPKHTAVPVHSPHDTNRYRLERIDTRTSGPGGGPVPKAPDPTPWQRLGDAVGQVAGFMGDLWHNAQGFLSAIHIGDMLKSIADDFKQITDAITPQDRAVLKDVLGVLLGFGLLVTIGPILTVVWGGLKLTVWWMQNAVPWTLQLEKAIRDGLGNALGWVKDRIGDFFGKLGDLKDKLGEVKDKFTAWAGDLKDKFLTWGKDMIGNLVSGIQAKMTDLGNALAGVGGKIAAALHHSTPDEGPLANDDQWMPDMMSMFARQIRDGTPGLSAAMRGAASAMAQGLRPSGGYLPAGAGGAGGMGAGSTVIVINGTSTLEAMKLIDYALAKRDRGVNIETRAPTGYGFYQFGTLGGH